MKILVENGADVNAGDEDGVTALIRVSWDGYPWIVSLLVEMGADVNAKDHEGYTALIAASYAGDRETASTLVELGADMNAKDNDGWTALMTATNKGHIGILAMLVRKGAEVTAEQLETLDLVGTHVEQPKIMKFLREIIDNRKNINMTPLVIVKGLTQNNELLVPYAHKEIIHHITSFF